MYNWSLPIGVEKNSILLFFNHMEKNGTTSDKYLNYMAALTMVAIRDKVTVTTFLLTVNFILVF